MTTTQPQTTTAPATTRVFPSRVRFGKVKKSKNLHSGMQQVLAEVYIDGALVGHAEDEGNGGAFSFRPSTPGAFALVDAVFAEFEPLRPGRSFLSQESLWNDLLDEHDAAKSLARTFKNGKRASVLTTSHPEPLSVEEDGWRCPEWATVNCSTATLLADPEGCKRSGITSVWDGEQWLAL